MRELAVLLIHLAGMAGDPVALVGPEPGQVCDGEVTRLGVATVRDCPQEVLMSGALLWIGVQGEDGMADPDLWDWATANRVDGNTWEIHFVGWEEQGPR